MRILALTLVALAFLYTDAIAQPVIEHVTVDELKHQVVLSGEFYGMTDIRVYCDSLLLPLSSSNDTEVRAMIPDSGKGSCGPVWLVASTGKSNARHLTFWHYTHYYQYVRPYSDGGAEFKHHYSVIHLRFDWFFQKTRDEIFMIAPTARSNYVLQAFGYDGAQKKYTGPTYNKRGRVDSLLVTMQSRSIYDKITERGITLDEKGEIIPYDYTSGNCGPPGIGTCEYGRTIAPTEFLPALLSVDPSPSPLLLVTGLTYDYIEITPKESGSFEIVNLVGGIVQSGLLYSGEQKRISITDLPAGYYLILTSTEKIKFAKL